MYEIPQKDLDLVVKALYRAKAIAYFAGFKTIGAELEYAIMIMETLLKAK